MKRNSTKNTRFEDTEEGRRILSSLSESLQQVRRENQHNGEARILMQFAKKNKTKYYTTPFEKDLDKLIMPVKSADKKISTEILLPQIQKYQGFNRINHPKN